MKRSNRMKWGWILLNWTQLEVDQKVRFGSNC